MHLVSTNMLGYTIYKSFNLANNLIGESSIQEIVTLIKSSPQIVNFDLRGNAGLTDELLKKLIFRLLKNISRIKKDPKVHLLSRHIRLSKKRDSLTRKCLPFQFLLKYSKQSMLKIRPQQSQLQYLNQSLKLRGSTQLKRKYPHQMKER